jgi:integrase
MPTLTITTRPTASGRRYIVRFRLGGRAYPIQHGGSFKTLKLAKARRDLIGGEIAAGRNPRLLLEALLNPPEPSRAETLAAMCDRYEASRIDYADETAKNLPSHLKRIRAFFGDDCDPLGITIPRCQEFASALANSLKASSVRRYWATFRLLLDFVGLEPNPARDRRVKLPAIVEEEPKPPTAQEFLAILDHISARWPLPLITIEQTAMAVGETSKLAWGDVDVAESKLRLQRKNVKGAIRARARWVQVPRWLMDVIERTCPLEDRTAERRVFPGFTADAAKNAMARACKAAGVTHFHPHDLRHRRISLWHINDGIPAKELAARAGHSRASMSLDVYSHVLMDSSEASPTELLSRCGLSVVAEVQ